LEAWGWEATAVVDGEAWSLVHTGHSEACGSALLEQPRREGYKPHAKPMPRQRPGVWHPSAYAGHRWR
jgi:hypothetical protein